MRTQSTPLGAISRGLAAGLIGTAVMTAVQELWAKLQSSQTTEHAGGGEQGDVDQEPDAQDPWEQASMPAQVARRVIEGVFHKEVSPKLVPVLTHGMHWAYGTAWGAAYGPFQDTFPARPLRRGLLFGTGVWVMAYVQLVPMGLYELPWRYGAKDLATELGFHLAYGCGVSFGYRQLEAR
ncbi:MAG TPA: hypothetical protein VGV57_07860 [Thermoleophilaceae bacterium]|nr:hypothetical protein [Thermoleophilaceae bacterium]